VRFCFQEVVEGDMVEFLMFTQWHKIGEVNLDGGFDRGKVGRQLPNS
jgi:hypothetical protein